MMKLLVVGYSFLVGLVYRYPILCQAWQSSTTRIVPTRTLMTTSLWARKGGSNGNGGGKGDRFWSRDNSNNSNDSDGGGKNNEGESSADDDAERRRMEIVRSLQTTFYSSGSNTSSNTKDRTQQRQQTISQFNGQNGIVYNLPLWRVPWIEVIGRTNVLHVHNPIYTNMFETVLRSEPPWYIGHLYLPTSEGNRNGTPHNDPAAKNKLVAWDEQIAKMASSSSSSNDASIDTTGSTDDNENSVHDNVDEKLGSMLTSAKVLGTLLRIADYRRLKDGRLLLLVQGLERFVVLDAIQELPYGIAHVQLLPDVEEIDDDDTGPNDSKKDEQEESSWWIRTRTEGDVSLARGMAIADSFGRWHRYEYENTLLPIPLRSEIQQEDIIGSAISKVLPYAPFSQVVKAEQILKDDTIDTSAMMPVSPTTSSNGFEQTATSSSSSSPSSTGKDRSKADYAQNTLEYRLLQGKILYVPKIIEPSILELSTDQIERMLWIALDKYLKRTKKAVSPVLLGFLPSDVQWPQSFVLEQISNAINEQTELVSKFVKVSSEYPNHRRQKRVSYSIPAVLEDIHTVHKFRQVLLSIPSTKLRLAYTLQLLQDELNIGNVFQ